MRLHLIYPRVGKPDQKSDRILGEATRTELEEALRGLELGELDEVRVRRS